MSRYPIPSRDTEEWGERRDFNAPSLAWEALVEAGKSTHQAYLSDRYHDAVRMQELWTTEYEGGYAPVWYHVTRENGTHIFEDRDYLETFLGNEVRNRGWLVIAVVEARGASDVARARRILTRRPDSDSRSLFWRVRWATIAPDGQWKPFNTITKPVLL